MFQSELLQEKYRVQRLLSEKNPSVHEYMVNAHNEAKAIAKLHGFKLNYVEPESPEFDLKIPVEATGS